MCAHVSINEVACYRTERTLMECADPLRMNGRRTPPVFSSERNMKWLRGVVTDQ